MEDEEVIVEERKQRSWWLIVALVAAVAAGVLLASTVWENRWSENSVGNELIETQAPDLQAWCAAQATYDAIRRELFRRAAQVRGSDQQAYTRLADFALLRVSGPVARDVDGQLQSVTCSGTANLDLPPGVAASGGRRSLSGDLDYMVQPAADGTGNVVRLGNADSIVIPLATLSRRGAPQTAPLVPPELQEQVTQEQRQPEQEDRLPPEESQDTSSPAVANPSFDCNRARTRGEIAVCGDPGLAALDRQMAAQFNAALGRSDSGQRRLLNRTRGRFLSFRDRCATNQCIAETYRSRMREISDIMAGRWRG
ncbi:MAG: lysozyme inhibitor LprI family protein [Sphingomicrobium sp.]